MSRKKLTERLLNDSSRRSFLKKGGLAALGTGLLTSTAGTAAAQDWDETPYNENELFNENEAQKGLIFRRNFKPLVPFTVVSPILDFSPDIEEIEDNVWSDYNTRIIRYLDRDEQVLFFPANAAEMGPFESNLGFSPDDEFFQEGALEDNELGENELAQGTENLAAVRPQIFVMEIDTGLFGDAQNIVTVQFSEVREEDEQSILEYHGPFDTDV